MANQHHLSLVKQGVAVWNDWRGNNPTTLPDLSSENLTGLKLPGANLSRARFGRSTLTRAELASADLTDAGLYQVEFYRADLRNADLRRADLSGAKFHNANLTAAVLHDANLFRVDFIGTELAGARFARARCSLTTFAGVDLGEVLELADAIHRGPSNIDTSTFLRSLGKTPTEFFRGAGVPDSFITHTRSFVALTADYQSCFISYSSHDRAFAERLHADLRARNLRCWFAPEDLKIGDRFQETIEDSIRLYDKVMIVLSDASVQSRWVEREVNAAREREDREDRTVLFPIRIDDTVMNAPQPWAADIRRTRHIGDFREWEAHASYIKAFERLLRDLKA